MQSENQDVGFSFTDNRPRADVKARWNKYNRLKRHLRGQSWKSVFPIGKDNKTIDELQGQYSNTLTARYEGSQATGTYIIENQFNEENRMIQIAGTNQGNRLDSPDGLSKCLSNGGGQGAKTGLILQPNNFGHKAGDGITTRKHSLTDIVPSLQAYCGGTQQSYVIDSVKPMRWRRTEQGKENRRKSKQETGIDYTPFNGGNRILIESEDNIIGCVTNAINKESLLGNKSCIRRLTPLECERLQGYPDGWTALGSDDIPISDSQRYKMLGNAVTVNVISAIVERMQL